jgi:hypothetical protein
MLRFYIELGFLQFLACLVMLIIVTTIEVSLSLRIA